MKIITMQLDEVICLRGSNLEDVKIKINRMRTNKGIELALEAPRNIPIYREEYVRELDELQKKLDILKQRRKNIHKELQNITSF